MRTSVLRKKTRSSKKRSKAKTDSPLKMDSATFVMRLDNLRAISRWLAYSARTIRPRSHKRQQCLRLCDEVKRHVNSISQAVVRRQRPGEEDPSQLWRTPLSLFQSLDKIFQFTIDACASRDDHLLPRYWSKERDAVLQDWRKERAYCNPPFKSAGRFMPKAAESELTVMVYKLNALTAPCLHQNRPDYTFVPAKRLQFIPAPGVRAPGNPYGNCLLVWGRISREQLSQMKRANWMLL